MKIILLKDIENIGKKYEVKEIKDGYARNFLLPQNLVKIADEKNLEWLKNQLELEKKKSEEELVEISKLASKIDGLEVEIPVKVGDKGQLFEKITPQKIAVCLKELGYNISKNNIATEDITELGEFPVKIKFDHNLEAEIKLIVIEQAGGKKEEKEEEIS